MVEFELLTLRRSTSTRNLDLEIEVYKKIFSIWSANRTSSEQKNEQAPKTKLN